MLGIKIMLQAPVRSCHVVILLLTVTNLRASSWELPDSSLSSGSSDLFLNQFAVQLRKGGHDVALHLARQYGFTLRGEVILILHNINSLVEGR